MKIAVKNSKLGSALMFGRIQRKTILDFDSSDPPSRHGDRLFVMSLAVLCAVGILMVYSASFFMARETYHDPFHFLKDHAFRLGLGTMLFLAAYSVDYHRLRGWSRLILGACMILLVAVLFVGSGAHRWITLFGIRIQPSEFARIALVVYLADWCSRHSKRLQDDYHTYLLALGIIAAPVLLVVIEPSFSASSMIALAGGILLFMAGARLKHLALTILPAVPVGLLVAIMKPYRVRRFLAFLFPDADPLGAGYHTIQSLIAVGSGQLFGVGPGASGQKNKFLPEAHCDFIYSILCEEWGFIGGMLILVLFFIFIWRGIKIALKAPDQFGFLLAAGLTCSIGLFVVAHLLVALGLAPVTGLPLPFVSYGGSALIANMTACGLILNISRHAQSPESI
jgi:cell division protein FtsW